MKTVGSFILVLSLVCLALSSAHATTVFVNDGTNESHTFWGGKLAPGYIVNQDVLGEDFYDLSGMNVTFSDTKMKVQIFGAFSREDLHADLFLSSTGWKTSGSGDHQIGDTFTQDEGWDYIVSSDTADAYKGIWKIDWKSRNFRTTQGGRVQQAWVHDLESGGERVKDNVNVTYDDDSLTFEFDITGLGALSENSWGVHFTPPCGNDVIEGGTPVPEPATALLLIGGLAGLSMIKMRKKSS